MQHWKDPTPSRRKSCRYTFCPWKAAWLEEGLMVGKKPNHYRDPVHKQSQKRVEVANLEIGDERASQGGQDAKTHR